MADPKDPASKADANRTDDQRKEPTAVGDRGGDRRSGRVAYDSRGNPIWEWQLETGVYTRDVNTQRLKKLDLGELSLVDTAIQKKPATPSEPGKSPGGGFNPYDRGASGAGFNPYDNTRSLGGKASGRQAPLTSVPARKPSDMRKLDEWIKMKKGLKGKEDD